MHYPGILQAVSCVKKIVVLRMHVILILWMQIKGVAVKLMKRLMKQTIKSTYWPFKNHALSIIYKTIQNQNHGRNIFLAIYVTCLPRFEILENEIRS